MKKRKAKRIPIAENNVGKTASETTASQAGFGYEMPPDFDLILIYFDQKGETKLALDFYSAQERSDWKTIQGAQIKNWKVAATEWLYNYYHSQRLEEWKKSHTSGMC